MIEFSYFSTDWGTRTITEELPLSDVNYTRPLGFGGELSANLVISMTNEDGTERTDEQLRSLVQRYQDATAPVRSLLAVTYRDTLWPVDVPDVVDFLGIIMPRTRQPKSAWQLQAVDYSAFLDQPLLVNKSYTNVDEMYIPEDLIAWLQAQPYCNYGIRIAQPGQKSNQTVTKSYDGAERTSISEIITSFTALDKGYDVSLSYNRETDGTFSVYFNRHFPYKGLSPAASPLVFTFPGNIQTYSYSEDGSSFANRLEEQGGIPGGVDANPDASPIAATRVATSLLGLYPQVTKTITRNDITVQSTLERHADEDMRLMLQGVPFIPVITVSLNDEEHPYGSYQTGDHGRFDIDDPTNFPDIVSFTARIIEITPNLREGTVSLQLDGATL